MKNKKVTYALGFLLLFLWGTVFYKIFSNSSEDFEVVAPEEYNYVQLDSSFTPKPKFELNIDYTDPFLGQGKLRLTSTNSEEKNQESVKTSLSPSKEIIKPKQQEVRLKWPVIKYFGFVDNQVNIKVDKRSYLIQKGDSILGVKLLEFWPDSVHLMYGDVVKTYSK